MRPLLPAGSRARRPVWPGTGRAHVDASNGGSGADGAGRGGSARIVAEAREEALTIRQLAQKAGGASYPSFAGTPATIADDMAERLPAEAYDGFNAVVPTVPEGLDDIVDRVGPELQRRGLFRTRLRCVPKLSNAGDSTAGAASRETPSRIGAVRSARFA